MWISPFDSFSHFRNFDDSCDLRRDDSVFRKFLRGGGVICSTFSPTDNSSSELFQVTRTRSRTDLRLFGDEISSFFSGADSILRIQTKKNSGERLFLNKFSDSVNPWKKITLKDFFQKNLQNFRSGVAQKRLFSKVIPFPKVFSFFKSDFHFRPILKKE